MAPALAAPRGPRWADRGVASSLHHRRLSISVTSRSCPSQRGHARTASPNVRRIKLGPRSAPARRAWRHSCPRRPRPFARLLRLRHRHRGTSPERARRVRGFGRQFELRFRVADVTQTAARILLETSSLQTEDREWCKRRERRPVRVPLENRRNVIGDRLARECLAAGEQLVPARSRTARCRSACRLAWREPVPDSCTARCPAARRSMTP